MTKDAQMAVQRTHIMLILASLLFLSMVKLPN